MSLEKLIFGMLTENTGIALMDSGGENGRAWQRNAGKSLADFQNAPVATLEDEAHVSVSTFHYLTEQAGLSLDALCDEYNRKKVKDWESDIYGVSKAGRAWIDAHGFTVGESWNTYNGEWNGDATLQGTNLERVGSHYILLQVHGGADVRGGYTDAKLFKLEDEYLRPPEACATYDGKDYATTYSAYGTQLATADGEVLPEGIDASSITLTLE